MLLGQETCPLGWLLESQRHDFGAEGTYRNGWHRKLDLPGNARFFDSSRMGQRDIDHRKSGWGIAQRADFDNAGLEP
ncbi:hypothetical protein PFI31113_03757 [Pandoraea fibrosis]|uniref:Uncharacterized protein n=1 Tax=Pandoraea fibrosis TaxID=1891094 RepID=A0A5E4XBW7_9BURK|nr:hypothetical protein PFI31113_03757 [Pandoraea fibrosis]